MTTFEISIKNDTGDIHDIGVIIEADTWLDAINWYVKANPEIQRDNVFAYMVI